MIMRLVKTKSKVQNGEFQYDGIGKNCECYPEKFEVTWDSIKVSILHSIAFIGEFSFICQIHEIRECNGWIIL